MFRAHLSDVLVSARLYYINLPNGATNRKSSVQMPDTIGTAEIQTPTLTH